MRTPTRIILVLLLCFVGLIGLAGFSIYYFLDKYSYNDLYKRLETRARISAAQRFEEGTDAEVLRMTQETFLEKLPEQREYFIPLPPDADLQALSRAHEVPAELLRVIRNDGRGTAKRGLTFYAGVLQRSGPGDHAVIVSAHNYYASHHLHYLRNLLTLLMVLTTLISAAFFLYFSRRVFDPITRVTDELRRISTENMHLRLAETRADPEITALITTLNGLLDRMETAFETQKNFISNASHEFGTPLTSLIGEAEVALAKERTSAEYQETLRGMLQQADRLDKITRSLLFLARTGYGEHRITFNIVRMDEVVWSVKVLMDDLHPGHKLHVDFSLLPENPRKLKVNGNMDLLQLAVGNIVNNAIKYGAGKPVQVSVAAGNQEVIILVKDEGIGIPEADLPFIFDPFFRASNTAYFEGFGIGLPLTRNILKLHKGRIQVSSQPGTGTTVQVNLPTLE
ncbi:MAG: two-component sensor histidine kinase [Flavobacteriales bacterium]|nr:two-component sensor histidine kinase [Flavobacteriales bacterium]